MEGYEIYTDEQLIQRLRDGDESVMDYILNKYNYKRISNFTAIS